MSTATIEDGFAVVKMVDEAIDTVSGCADKDLVKCRILEVFSGKLSLPIVHFSTPFSLTDTMPNCPSVLEELNLRW